MNIYMRMLQKNHKICDEFGLATKMVWGIENLFTDV